MAYYDPTADEKAECQTGNLETIDEEIGRWAAHTRRLQAALSWRIALGLLSEPQAVRHLSVLSASTARLEQIRTRRAAVDGRAGADSFLRIVAARVRQQADENREREAREKEAARRAKGVAPVHPPRQPGPHTDASPSGLPTFRPDADYDAP